MDVKFIDTTDWQEMTWVSSGGTREKRILQDENDLLSPENGSDIRQRELAGTGINGR